MEKEPGQGEQLKLFDTETILGNIALRAYCEWYDKRGAAVPQPYINPFEPERDEF